MNSPFDVSTACLGEVRRTDHWDLATKNLY